MIADSLRFPVFNLVLVFSTHPPNLGQDVGELGIQFDIFKFNFDYSHMILPFLSCWVA